MAGVVARALECGGMMGNGDSRIKKVGGHCGAKENVGGLT